MIPSLCHLFKTQLNYRYSHKKTHQYPGRVVSTGSFDNSTVITGMSRFTFNLKTTQQYKRNLYLALSK